MLGDNIYWTLKGSELWQRCGVTHQQFPWSTREVVQQISRKGKGAVTNSAVPVTAIAKTGVIVFGSQPAKKLKREYSCT